MKEFNQKIQEKFEQMQLSGKLYRSELTGNQVWEEYLLSFSPEDNPIFRDPNSTEHCCNHCKNFIRRYGNIVSVNKDYEVETMFDVEIKGRYENTSKVLSSLLKSSKVAEVFFETFQELQSLPYEACKKTNDKFQIGVDKNVKRYTKEEAEKYGVVKENETRTFHHMHLFLEKQFVDTTGSSVETIMGQYRDGKNVFQRGMETISLDTLQLVKDLINQGSLLDGTTHLYKIEQMIPLKREYDTLSASQRDNWCWTKSYKFPLAKFKNELIGVLCSELSEGKELNEAVQSWNKRVDPANYMKVTAPITKKQIAEARAFVEENGYTQSFDRRFATIDDIKVSEILHSNIGDGKIKNVSIFDSVKSTSTRHKRSEFDGVEEVSIEKFMKDILPSCTSIEAFLTNSQEENMVSLTTANNPDSKPIFKWDNNYSWTFNGNLAGKSQIKENVKTAGGKIDGVLRCSLQWNDEDTPGIVDFDLHCKQSKSDEIHYANKRSRSGGCLDVDMINPSKVGIENITWQNQPQDMIYSFYVRNFNSRPNRGFKVEIEFNGEVYNYVQTGNPQGNTEIAVVTVKNGLMEISHKLQPTDGFGVSKEIYGLETNNFHKVNLVCLSPNHWGENNVGNKHYFFILEGAKTPSSIRSFHNENLIPELANHRRVLEVLANQTMVEPVKRGLSGLGFNSSVKDELILKLQGSHKRAVKLKFDGVDTKAPSKKKVLQEVN